MRKVLLSAILLLISGVSSFAQTNYNWITPNKTYLKVYVAQDGMYRIDRNDFSNAGINPATVDPRTVKLMHKGSEVPVYFSGQQDGTFDPGDYLDFFGTRNYGGLTKVYDHLNNLSYTLNEYFNPYSDTSIYWIDWGGANGQRYQDFNYTSPTPYSSSSFTDYVHLEKDYYYTQGENFSASDYRFLTTEKYRAEGWMWSQLSNGVTLSESFTLPMLSSTVQNATFRVLCYPTQRNTSVTNEHTVELRVNNNLIATIQANDANRIDSTVTFSSSLLTSGSNTVSLRYTHVAGFTSFMHVDLMQIGYPRKFALSSSAIDASLAGSDTTSKRFSVSGGSNVLPANIYDVKNYKRISSSSFSADTLKFTANGNARIVAVNNNITLKPLRIKQRSVPDLASSTNGADYLIIYNKFFETQAEQLRAYRQTRDGFRSFKAEVEDIYDIFGYGFESPEPIRYFTKHVYDNWQLPKMSYVCLFGRGTFDPKKNLSTSTYTRNFIPVYGYPPSDGYYANFNIGTFCYYDMVAVGRIPVYTTSEAQNVVDKIISYEAQPVEPWVKNFIYMTGGGTLTEQISHQTKSNVDIVSFINPSPISGEAVKVYRTDSSGYLSYNVKDSAINSIDRGATFANYRGHAGSHNWEITLDDANALSNETRLPLVLSLTCFTGENALANYRGFGEQFTYLPGKGSIGFVGTTGWSYAQNGNDFGSYITTSLRNDTNRRTGKITQYAHKVMSKDSISFNVRHTLNCYSLLGDPAAELKLPKRPEYSVTNSDYALSNSFPTVGEYVTLTIFPKNLGLFSDSTKVRFQLKKDDVNYKSQDEVIRNFAFLDTLSYTFQIDSISSYDVQVTLDQDNWTPLEDKSNNSITVNIPVKNKAFVPLKPVANAVINTDSVTFTGLNPRIASSGNSIKLIVQVDTNSAFSSPALRTFNTTSVSGVATSFRSVVPVRNNSTLHYWRTNAVINGDSTGWSGVQHFIYKIPSYSSASKSGNNETVPENVLIEKSKGAQFPQSEMTNATFNGSGVTLSSVPATLFIRSYGSNAEEASYFSIGNRNVYIDGGKNTGLSLLKVKKLTGSILEFKNLKMNTASSSDSLVNFLNTYDSTHFLMLLNAAYFAGGQYLSTNAKTKLRTFGSIYCDSIGLMSYFHTWSLIGWLGASQSQASEMFDPCCRPAPHCVSCDHWGVSNSVMDVSFRKTSATINNIVGPARQWNNFSWSQTLAPNSSIKFDVYGIDAEDNQQYLLFSDVTSNDFADLSFVNSIRYPRLNLVAKLDLDTVTGNAAPVLNQISVDYIPASEFAWDINNLTLQSTYKVGDELKFTTNIHNVGYADISGYIVSVYKKSASIPNLIYSDTTQYVLTPGASAILSKKFKIPYYRDSMNAIVQMRLYDKHNEFYTFNNDIVIPLYSARLYRPVNITVYSDGSVLRSGDYVSRNPELRVESDLEGGDAAISYDTGRVSVILNGRQLPYSVSDPVIARKSQKDSGPDAVAQNSGGKYIFRPVLENGRHELAVIVRQDEYEADTAYFEVLVSDNFGVIDLYNYPNPMRGETSFMFTLAGSDNPDNVKIRIYTVGGRLIKEIIAPAIIGNNSIVWDGRDSDGDVVANGTYLYKLVTSDGSGSESRTEKLVILR